MATVIFLSHAGSDSPNAAAIALELTAAGIEVHFDRQELRLGDSFLAFMEKALSASDYCLLLWSRHAALTEWVRLEWEAALYRSVQEKRSFLVTGLLENVPLPALIAPRLRVDLFPELQPGLGQIIETWRADREAETQTHRPVASASFHEFPVPGSETIYVTSEAFGITTPLKANLEAPAGLYLDRIITGFKLPKVFDHEGLVGARFSYRLMHQDKPLDRATPLAAQNVKDKAVLWLETTITPYSQSEPLHGTLQSMAFRELNFGLEDECINHDSKGNAKPDILTEELARKAYSSAVMRSGLGPVSREGVAHGAKEGQW